VLSSMMHKPGAVHSMRCDRAVASVQSCRLVSRQLPHSEFPKVLVLFVLSFVPPRVRLKASTDCWTHLWAVWAWSIRSTMQSQW